MPTPLAKLYSTIDSVKRVLADRVSAPVEDVLRTVGRLKEDSAAFRETQKAGGPAAMEAMLNVVLNSTPAGMIVPAERLTTFQTFNGLKKSLAAGADAETVFKNSGVYKMPQDDVLRAVISDIGAKLKTTNLADKGAPTNLGELLDHPELFKTYPELAQIEIRPSIGYRTASYSSGDLVSGSMGTIELGSFTTPEELLSAVLHETQHGTQWLGGMAPGGNPGQFWSDPIRHKAAAKAATDVYESHIKRFEDLGLPYYSTEAKAHPDYPALAAARKESIALDRLNQDAFDKYAAIPGETEARLVEAMHKAGKGAETFPPRFQSTVKDLNREDLISNHYVDLQDHIQTLLDKFAPRP